MRNLFLAAGLCLAIPSTPLAAEPGPSLEQDYAALCANKPEPASETCVLLKKALIAKLSGNASSPATAELPFTARSPAAPSIEQAKREEIRRRWGLYADMVGKTYVEVDTKGSPLAIATYSWEVPGAAMVVTRYATTETGEITTGDCPPSKTYRRVEPATGRLTRTILRPCWPAVPAADVSIQPDGAAVEKQVDGKYTDRISRNSDGTVTWIRYVPQKNGLWRRLGYGTSISHERTSQYLASLRADYEARLAQKAQSGDGFGSILAGAAMGAMLGGGGQSSVDLAVAGAQSAAQGGNTLDVLNSMGGVAAANAAESKRQLDETIARAQGGSSGGASIASTGSFSSSAGSAVAPGNPAHSLTRKTIQVYFEIGTTPKIATKDGEEDDGHNTHCQSTVFPVTIDWDPSLEASGGNLKYANPVLDGMKSAFIDKCNRTDPSRPIRSVSRA